MALLLFSTVSNVGLAMDNPYYYHDCTWTAWQYAHDYLGITLPAWGGASGWCAGAERDGYSTGDVPAANAIMVWRGHVGFITQVSADGQSVYIVEGGWGDGDNWRHEGWYAANGPSTSGKAFIGYVYLADVPPDTTPVGSSGLVGSNAQREAELAELRVKKAMLTSQINTAEAELAVLTNQLDQANRECSERLRTIYMFGNGSYVDILFSADSLGDFIEKAQQISQVIQMDRNTVNQLENLAEEQTAKKAELEQALAELNEIHI